MWNSLLKKNENVSLADITGIWMRDYIRTPENFDDTTLVWWFQSDLYHVDIRIPRNFVVAGSPPNLTSYSQLPKNQLLSVFSAEGFAGTTEVDNSVCTWVRIINYRGKLHGADTGLLEHTPEGLVEMGIHDSYSELWQSSGSTPNTRTDLEVPTGVMMNSANGEQCLILVYTKTRFALGRGRPADLSRTYDSVERLKNAIAQDDLASVAELMDMEFCAGIIDERGGVISVSTNPFRVGAVVFESKQINQQIQVLNVSALDFYGVESNLLFQTVKQQ